MSDTKHPTYNVEDVQSFYLQHVRDLVPYNRTKANGFCPFHEDRKTKSFAVDLVRGYFKCFSPSCGVYGGISKFCNLLKIDRPSFIGGVDYQSIYNSLKVDPSVRDYLLRRGISQHYVSYLQEAGLVRSETYEDVLWVVFPIFTVTGSIVGLNKISVENRDKKVLGYYKEGYWIDTNFDFSKTIIVVEAVINALTLNDLGFNAMSIITAGNSIPERVSDNATIVLMLDNDMAGRKAVRQINRDLDSKVKSLRYVEWPLDSPKGYDPNDVIRDVDSARDFIQEAIDKAVSVNTWADFSRLRSLVKSRGR